MDYVMAGIASEDYDKISSAVKPARSAGHPLSGGVGQPRAFGEPPCQSRGRAPRDVS
jgi:hypothetical protein